MEAEQLTFNEERPVIDELLHHTPEEIRSAFSLEYEDGVFSFVSKTNERDFLAVSEYRQDPTLARVNANFHFGRPAGSHNYPELIQLAKYFLTVFNCSAKDL